MQPIGFLLILVILTLPAAWLVSEFRGKRWLRITLGVLALGFVTTCVWLTTKVITTLNYNSRYGFATRNLIETSLHQIEDGQLNRVLTIWRGLDRQYEPTYENRAGYDKLVEEATSRMRGDVPIESGSASDAPVFTADSWNGHWEEEGGHWLVIDEGFKGAFDIVRSGEGSQKQEFVSVSPDFTVLKFKDGNLSTHTVTLKNKYEATDEWFDIQNDVVTETKVLHKLIRATEEQKTMTQQPASGA